ncbi:MAG: family 20 glycosylhydrolase [Bacteroidota bacterium]
MKTKYLSGALILIMIAATALKIEAQNNIGRYNLIPFPTSLKAGNGNLVLTAESAIILKGSQFENEADQLNEYFSNSFGKPLKKSSLPLKNSIVLKFDENIKATEGYRLVITPQQATAYAGTPAGMFMAVQTIRQLLPETAERKGLQLAKTLSLPELIIQDHPAYGYRGMMLDVSRHFFSINYLEKFIDRLALYKMNKLHLHLTDDQGWRIEIKKYPKLTEEGAWRSFNNQDSICMQRATNNPDFTIDTAHIITKNEKTLYGGFYTQQEMKDLVAYAAARHIEIIPEIDMPGHMMAAINSYPYLTCDGENTWGALFTKPICPCNETTYEFAENVFSEIMEIFPSKYIHIGGDEVDRTNWGKSQACNVLMQREGIKNLAGLQSYFINRMEKFFNSRGKKLIGWDEIIEGGISSTANIMYWRKWVPNAPVEAAKNGNSVIMTPGEPLYFDNEADKFSIYNVYHFNPIPEVLNAAESKAIIGAQANTWTEWIPSEQRADYMTMPRMTALAEMLWTNQPAQYNSYLKRLVKHYNRMNVLQINYRLPDLPGLLNEYVFTNEAKLRIAPPLKSAKIRYTTDGTLPHKTSPLLPATLIIKKAGLIRVAAFTPTGKNGDVYNLNYKQQPMQDPVTDSTLKPGLKATYHKGQFSQTAVMQQTKIDSSFIINRFEVPAAINAPSFGIRFKGIINVPAAGIYSFFLTADDGAVLRIANTVVVDNDGNHSSRERSGQVALKKGAHPLELDFIEGGGGYALKLKYSVNGLQQREVPSSWLKH